MAEADRQLIDNQNDRKMLPISLLILRPNRACDVLPATLQRTPDQAHHGFVRKWFSQESDCSGFQGLFFDPLFLVCGDENDRHIHAGAVHVLLNLQTAHPGHLHVDYRAIRIGWIAEGRKELLAGCVCPNPHPPGCQQTPQCPRHRTVIIDDMDARECVGQSIASLPLVMRFLPE
jgi:hypothetical protein